MGLTKVCPKEVLGLAEKRHGGLGGSAAPWTSNATMWVVVDSHHLLLGFSQALSLDELTTQLQRKESNLHGPS